MAAALCLRSALRLTTLPSLSHLATAAWGSQRHISSLIDSECHLVHTSLVGNMDRMQQSWRPCNFGAPTLVRPILLQQRNAATKANAVRPGMMVEMDGKLRVVSKAAHTAGIGRQAGIVSLELKDSKTGSKSMTKVQTDAMITIADTERQDLQVLYTDDEGIHLMDPVSFEQMIVSPGLMGDMTQWVQEGLMLQVLRHEGDPVSVVLPETLIVTVVDTPEDRVSDASSRKVARVSSGAKVHVPSFVQNGHEIVIRPATGEFIRRASEK